ncbi:MAG: DUF2314 domain-containing protein [Maritimibacter sp.]
MTSLFTRPVAAATRASSLLLSLTLNLFLSLSLGLALSTALPGPLHAETVTTASDDAAMSASRDTARSYLAPLTETLFDADGTGNPALTFKVSFPVGNNGNEVIWVGGLHKTDTGFTGSLSNQPEQMKGLNHGDAVTFTDDMIYDWGVESENGKYYGHFSTRVLLSKMDETSAAQVGAILEDNPVPPAWR